MHVFHKIPLEYKIERFRLSLASECSQNFSHRFMTPVPPPTTAKVGYAIGLLKLSANGQFFNGSQMAAKL